MTIDAKGRVSVPAELRAQLEDPELILIKWFDRSLALLPKPIWNRVGQLLARGHFNLSSRMTMRAFFGSARPVTPDPQGRILISEDMRDFAGLEREVVMLGLWNIIEVWSRVDHKRLQEQINAGVNEHYESVLSHVMGLADGEETPSPAGAPAEAVAATLETVSH